MEVCYDLAIDEFRLEDNNGKHKLVYAYFGLAIYFGQCLEETLSIMLWTDKISKNGIKATEEINEIIDSIENSKNTMGMSLKKVMKCYNLPETQIFLLEDILKKRNYLVHKYFKINIQKFYTEVGQLEMLEYFCDFVDCSKLLDNKLILHYKYYTDQFGVTDEMIAKVKNEMKLQEIKRTTI